MLAHEFCCTSESAFCRITWVLVRWFSDVQAA